MKYITTRLNPSVSLTALLLLSACGGGETTSVDPTQTMTKAVERDSCGHALLEITSFAADLQAIHQAGITPHKLYCKHYRSASIVDACGFKVTWFDILIDVPSSQVEQAQALGYSKFTPPADADYVEFPCLP